MNQPLSNSPGVSVIICTYMRPQPVLNLLHTILEQTYKPSQILIIDGSTDTATALSIQPLLPVLPIEYVLVDAANRGLTKQRNVGIQHLNEGAEIVFFLDDDVLLEPDFFEQMLQPFSDANVIGCDGLITNECYWQPISEQTKLPVYCQQLDQYYLKLASRDLFRAALGLFPLKLQPGKIPPYGHGKSSLPPTGKCYEVDHTMGGITAYRKRIFDHIQFSTFFEGYGLYEDFDFSVRASAYGILMTNTAARLSHHHASTGRPNTYLFGKMTVRNGWFVWRLKHRHPGTLNILKWHIITLLLAFVRLSNIFTPSTLKRQQAWGDFSGRMVAWITLLFIKPRIHA